MKHLPISQRGPQRNMICHPGPQDCVSIVHARHAWWSQRWGSTRARRRGCCNAVVGIDLGTTHSAVSIIESGHAKVIPSDGENALLPSLVCMQPVGGVHAQNVKDCAAISDKMYLAFNNLIICAY